MGRAELLVDLCAPQNLECVTGLLISSKEVRIAVPCTVLSKGGGGTGSKVVVQAVMTKGPNVKLHCGSWWRGAPTTDVYMDYRRLLQHANEDALRALHRKLIAISNSRIRGLARTQSVPGRILFEELGGGGGTNGSSGSGGGGGGSGGSRLHRTSSTGLPPSGAAAVAGGGGGLRRTSSIGLPQGTSGSNGSSCSGGGVGGSGLRRTSSTGLPSPSNSRPASSMHHPGQGLHRLSGSMPQRPGSPAGSLRAPLPAADGDLVTPQKQAPPLDSLAADMAAAAEHLLLPFTPEDSAADPRGAASSARLSLDSPDALHFPSPASVSPAGYGSGGSMSSPFDAGIGIGGIHSSGGGDAASVLAAGSTAASIDGGSRPPSRQPSGNWHQPYFAEFEGEEELALRGICDAGAQSGFGSEGTGARAATPPAGAAGFNTRASPSPATDRSQGGLTRQPSMTASELHEVGPSFNHVFVPPWAVPAVPQQPVVHAFREAGTQTSTGAADMRPPTRQSHTLSDAAEHFKAFMQHFSAGLPHLAMSLADLHLTTGGEDPVFVKSQYYFNSLLQLKDEMCQLEQRLQQAIGGDGGSSCE